MNIYKASDYEDMGRIAAKIIAAEVVLKPDCVLGLATGSSPVSTYEHLIKWYEEGYLDFSKVKTVNLDEYVGLSEDNDQSYHYFMDTCLFSRINIDKNNTYIPDGVCKDAEAECDDYEKKIENLGGIDIQVLGIGQNGHIGFNEPGKSFVKRTHVVELTKSTIEANKRFFEDVSMVPTSAITMGIGTIMKARKIIMLVNGEGKADILARAFKGDITPEVPASILQLHPDVTIVADEAALSRMNEI
ncbi:glucosamine-6-phosphate deaminase [Butyrivibrio sp. YAB3001]|uniref:glucosamine-6-phosphate deaminase n=1 Tax=Butyrivibrio sp. YAB3001 TaxID=1520812 RepID=UPI0008F68BB9|nr:glucosamine-6-phosphate deaminase [Butyrivibrio sp. YAB3001]SFC31417.1 glucosamine-6-phosphate deaminase [Butyrivibrio sp. YAB3001]